jgi:hypothetical protein
MLQLKERLKPFLSSSTAVILLLIFVQFAVASEKKVFTSPERYPVKFSVFEHSDSTLKIALPNTKKSSIRVFSLPQPSRLVLDIVGLTTRANVTDTLSSALVKRVRVGSHPNRVRVVFDLQESVNLKSQLKSLRAKASTGSEVIFGSLKEELQNKALSKKPIKETLTKKSEVTTQQPEATNTKIAVPTSTSIPATKVPPTQVVPTKVPATKIPNTPVSTPVTSPTTVATIVPTTTKQGLALAPKNSNSKLALNKVAFEYIDEDEKVPGVRVDLSTRSDYQLSRRSRDLYVLKVPNAKIENSRLALPYFPPQDFSSFVSLRAQQKDTAVEVFIYVEDGVHLVSFPEGDSIWLRSYKG